MRTKNPAADSSRAIRAALLGELREVCTQLDANESFFNSVSDPDLTEYAVYEHSALMARYRYLLSEVRKLDAISSVMRCEKAEAAAI